MQGADRILGHHVAGDDCQHQTPRKANIRPARAATSSNSTTGSSGALEWRMNALILLPVPRLWLDSRMARAQREAGFDHRAMSNRGDREPVLFSSGI
jgi:hypothetical protein